MLELGRYIGNVVLVGRGKLRSRTNWVAVAEWWIHRKKYYDDYDDDHDLLRRVFLEMHTDYNSPPKNYSYSLPKQRIFCHHIFLFYKRCALRATRAGCSACRIESGGWEA